MSDVQFKDNSKEVLDALEERIKAALTAAGLQAATYAQLELEKSPRRVDTGNLQTSISSQVEGHDAYVGTSVKYAIYVHEGTGKYSTGRETPWTYRDEEGNFHTTSGMPPNRFLKNGIMNNKEDIRSILEEYLRG